MSTLGQVYSCADVPVIVESEQPANFKEICSAAAGALGYLAGYGLVPKKDISIKLVNHSLEHYGYVAFGSYDRGSSVVSLMSLKAITSMESVPAMYGQAFDQVHYRGAVAHEIAHAVFHQNSPNARLSNAAQEYLAHVTQLAVLPPERRQKIILKADVGGWESGDAISEVYMAMAPDKFAVKSYLHFTKMDDPKAFIQILLNNKWFYVYAP
ncbi:hypothetical protein BTA51_05500 [Hahella sp. CCB-MM4]|uniref:DUF6639 family protein n=1 Tax=Hahella sp. (strain CCB-MM4) TaxID=1926491 RepID=UPI000B9C260D|nr:DUF6639 family protein [Hahella sp. CCB-MM4]OZG74461.1 hypothetical protein BTA51_05500 [Hahella sp. CCB-MM4]